MKTLVAVLALALVAVAAPAQGQGEPAGINVVDVTGAGTVAYAGSGTFTFNLDVGCAELISNPREDATVTVTDAPAWLNATDEVLELPATGCLNPNGRLSVPGTIEFTVSKSAPAVTAQTVHLKATLGETQSDEQSAAYTVAYKSNFTITPSVKFPLTVMNKTTTFTVTGVQASNAMSMIMVDDFTASGGALISGIGPLQYANKAGAPDTKTYTVTFTAPDGDWENVNATLKVYSHYNFDGMAGDPTDQKTITWQFVNGGVHDHDKKKKDTPAPIGPLVALGLVGLAASMRRRDD